jgi:exo-beta-1,3-glucanase (GH17 family)
MSTLINYYKIHGYCLGTSHIPEEKYRRRLGTLLGRTRWIRGYTVGEYKAHRTAKSMGYKVAVGAWLGSDLSHNELELAGLTNEAKAGFVDMAIVGSETLFRKELRDAQLAQYILQFKKSMPNIPVAVCDIADALLVSPFALASATLIGANIYPYWDGVSIDRSIAFLDKKYRELKRLAGKEVFISETGWPSGGNTIRKAVASPENALRYFKEFIKWATENNVRYFYFAPFDESWKKEFEHEQGGHWGRWYEDGTEKPWVNWK